MRRQKLHRRGMHRVENFKKAKIVATSFHRPPHMFKYSELSPQTNFSSRCNTRFWYMARSSGEAAYLHGPLRAERRSRRRRNLVPSLKRWKQGCSLRRLNDPSMFSHAQAGVPRRSGASPTPQSGPNREAYGFDQITFANGTVVGERTCNDDRHRGRVRRTEHRQRSAPVRRAFGCPIPVFTKVNQNGGSTMPAGNVGWGDEIVWTSSGHCHRPKATFLTSQQRVVRGPDHRPSLCRGPAAVRRRLE